MPRRLTENFIKRSKEVHGNKYDYSKVKYVNNKTKVCIICPGHGEFWQIPTSHINKKKGCKYCSYEKMRVERSLGKDEFIKRSKEIHSNKYDYSKVRYINNSTKVCIICNKHGEFLQSPSKHMYRAFGCPKCGIEERSIKRSLGKKEFIKRSKEVHGNKYDYSKVKYVNNKTKVCIICPEHGEFWQIPDNHFNHGCNKCGNNYSVGEEIIKKFLLRNKVNFIEQKAFKECRNKLPLPFDFYLPEYNLLIEYDGIQHHKPIKMFGGESSYKYTKNNDGIKEDFCNKNDIELLRIPFWKQDIIKNILTGHLQLYNVS